MDKKLEEDALMEEKKERRGEHEIEGIKEGEKLQKMMNSYWWSSSRRGTKGIDWMTWEKLRVMKKNGVCVSEIYLLSI